MTPRIAPIAYATATPTERATLDEIAQQHGSATNMKRTLARSLPALHALLEWYPLHATVQPFLGERLTALFCHAISAQADCLLCSTYFRRELIASGADPADLLLDPREHAVVDFGRQIAKAASQVDDALYARLATYFDPAQIVALTAFASLMIATNVFNSALKVELDDDLAMYQLPQVVEGVAHG
jgi:alkylhydroperoxidase family enzyme